MYDEERPSFKDIEAYRGDKESEITESDRALQQSLSYMQKYVAYFKNIQKIGVSCVCSGCHTDAQNVGGLTANS